MILRVLFCRALFFISMIEQKIIVQGFPGCFHEEAAMKFYGRKDLTFVNARTFEEQAKFLQDNGNDHLAIIAIENSIAGTILQNYRILREHNFRVIGEVYLRIVLNLMALPEQTVSSIETVSSHPMALNQCLKYFRELPEISLQESDDTALSAKRIREGSLAAAGAIASRRAAEIYDLEILAAGIESTKTNYTRFFVVQHSDRALPDRPFNKASIYLRTSHEKGALLKVLEKIYARNINLSKLQSFPILGEVNKYYFHLDLEFDDPADYENAIRDLHEVTRMIEVLGVYNKESIDDN